MFEESNQHHFVVRVQSDLAFLSYYSLNGNGIWILIKSDIQMITKKES